MAATIAASNTQQTASDIEDHHHHYRIKIADPVAARTVTVESTFSRLEELVGSEDEEKNWKGIVIALVVIVFICSMIATAIVLVTEEDKKYEPGDPFTFGHLASEKYRSKEPLFHWCQDDDKYLLYTNADDTTKYVCLVDPSSKEKVMIIQSPVIASLGDIDDARLSADEKFILIKKESSTDYVSAIATYLIREGDRKHEVDDGRQLQYVTWIGKSNEMVYVKDNSIFYKSSATAASSQVSTNGSEFTMHGIPDRVYKVNILKQDNMIWPSPFSSAFVYATLESRRKEAAANYISPNITLPSVALPDYSHVTLNFVVPSGNAPPRAVSCKIPNDSGFVTSISWMKIDKFMVTWLSEDQKSFNYIICDTAGACLQTFSYKVSSGLAWVGLFEPPKFNEDISEFYTILPNPVYEKKMYRNIAAVKTDKAKQRDPAVEFLTTHPWSDRQIVKVINKDLYFLSSSINYTKQHLYHLNLTDRSSRCLTCNTSGLLGYECQYVDAQFSRSGDYVYLSCLGPALPRYYVIPKSVIDKGQSTVEELNTEQYKALNASLEFIKMPQIEYLTLPLDNDAEASLKLHLPAQLDKKKIYRYGAIIMVSGKPEQQLATQQHTQGLITFLAKNQSYIVVQADVRGSAHLGEKNRQAIFRNPGLAEAVDVTKIANYLREHANQLKVNESQIAVMGEGYGGLVALHALSKSAFNCGVVVSPLTDLKSAGFWFNQRYAAEGATDKSLEYNCTTESSVCSKPASSSLLLMHGIKDAVIDFKNSLDLMRKLQLAEYSFKQQIYPEEGHYLEKSQVSSHYYQTITNYLNECFNGAHNHPVLI